MKIGRLQVGSGRLDSQSFVLTMFAEQKEEALSPWYCRENAGCRPENPIILSTQ
jgi:hypothetical protein